MEHLLRSSESGMTVLREFPVVSLQLIIHVARRVGRNAHKGKGYQHLPLLPVRTKLVLQIAEGFIHEAKQWMLRLKVEKWEW
jgi:hypothetical protein